MNYKTIFASEKSCALIPAILLALMTTIGGCAYFPHTYIADEIHGKIVDSETAEPISDAIVLIYWQQYGGLIHEDTTGYLVIEETVTDKEGKYSFESWGPKVTVSGYIDDGNPFVLFYKYGYSPRFVYNDWGQLPESPKAYWQSDKNPLMMESALAGVTIKLKPFKGSLTEYARELSSLDSPIDTSESEEHCYWENVPRYTAELVNLQKLFKRNGITC